MRSLRSLAWRRRMFWPRTARIRTYSTAKPVDHAAPSPHAQFYRDLVPGMLPIALLGSAIYLALRLAQSKLSTEKHMIAAMAHVQALEEELHSLQRAARIRQSHASAEQGAVGGPAKRSWFW